MNSRLFDPLTIRSLTLGNRVMMSPMCQYMAEDGHAADWHLVHLGARAVGGTGLVCMEATAVRPGGRISAQDLGIWDDSHVDGLARVTQFIHSQGAACAIQLAHSGRKGSRNRPWEGGEALFPDHPMGWQTVAPSPLPYQDGDPVPAALTGDEIAGIVEAFREGARRSLEAGMDVIEIHAAHGYLIHEFLSPLTNQRTDEYGGSFEGRIRFLLDIVDAVRSVWPQTHPLFVRLSVTDAMEYDNTRESWTLEQSIELSRILAEHGVDMIDCSSGGLVAEQRIAGGAGYQTPYAERIRTEAGIPTIAVGLITNGSQAEHIIRTGQADLVAVGREFMRDPHFTLRAAHETKQQGRWPNSYLRGTF